MTIRTPSPTKTPVKYVYPTALSCLFFSPAFYRRRYLNSASEEDLQEEDDEDSTNQLPMTMSSKKPKKSAWEVFGGSKIDKLDTNAR